MAHILAVDDDPDLCTLLKTALERDGHAVEIRTSGVTVTESLCRWADCILLDVMMPGEDGFATCRRIRAITQAPILFLTARTDEQSRRNRVRPGGQNRDGGGATADIHPVGIRNQRVSGPARGADVQQRTDI